MGDDCTSEYPALVPNTSISGLRVACEFDKLVLLRGRPGNIVSNNRASEATVTPEMLRGILIGS